MKRTQIYLDDAQDRALAERAVAEGRTKSELIREAVDGYLSLAAHSREAKLARFRAAVRAAAGTAPYLPDGVEYVRQVREADLGRERDIEARWRR